MMRKLATTAVMGALLMVTALSGCVVRGAAVARSSPPPPAPCQGGVWVDGYYGAHGRWHPGYWRCPGPYYYQRPAPGPRVYGRIDFRR